MRPPCSSSRSRRRARAMPATWAHARTSRESSWAERTPTPGGLRAWTFAKAIVGSQRARRIPAARGMKAVRGCQLTPQIGRRLRRGSRRASNAAAVARRKEDPSKGAEAPTDLRRDGQPAAVALSASSGSRGPVRVLVLVRSSDAISDDDGYCSRKRSRRRPPFGENQVWTPTALDTCFFVSAMLVRHRVVAPLSRFATR